MTIKCPQPVIKSTRPRGAEKWCDGWLVEYPVSYDFNGGPSYHVPPPIVPEGFELVGIGCGLQLNARPPLATMYLKPLKENK